jgi:hypothetical protein
VRKNHENALLTPKDSNNSGAKEKVKEKTKEDVMKKIDQLRKDKNRVKEEKK